jgi:4-hydroxybenzoate polyprenyltransferase
MATIAQRWMGRGNTTKSSYTLKDKLAGLMEITRPILSFMGALGVAAEAALSKGGFLPGQKACWDCWPLRKVEGLKLTQVHALFKAASPKTAADMGFIFVCISLILAVFAGFYANLTLVYIIPVSLIGIFALTSVYIFRLDSENFSKGINAFQSVTYYMLIVRIFMFLSVFLFFLERR